MLIKFLIHAILIITKEYRSNDHKSKEVRIES